VADKSSSPCLLLSACQQLLSVPSAPGLGIVFKWAAPAVMLDSEYDPAQGICTSFSLYLPGRGCIAPVGCR
jgi:hypothetical protein